MSTLAWTGRVTMAKADWGDETGSTVTFKLPMGRSEDHRNPFHVYTKRRKGRAGTRFMMACQTDGEAVRHAIYEDEVMLAGWNDSQQNGHTAKFWLANDYMGHPFDGISRSQKLLVSLVEIDDDQEPIDQQMRERVESQGIAPQSRPSYAAAMMCKNPDFWQWCASENGVVQVADEEGAKLWLYAMLGIESRAELDVNEEMRQKFEFIRKKFVATQETPF